MGKLVNPFASHAKDPQFEPGWNHFAAHLFLYRHQTCGFVFPNHSLVILFIRAMSGMIKYFQLILLFTILGISSPRYEFLYSTVVVPRKQTMRSLQLCTQNWLHKFKYSALNLRGGETGETDQTCLDLQMEPEENTLPASKKVEAGVKGDAWSTTSTPEEDKALGMWSAESSLQPESAPSEDRPPSSSAPSSTGLGVHGNCSWDRIRQIGIPVFELQELTKVVGSVVQNF